MRNLQKILALALALMMSFSLVVTANAAFSDDADINETYSESVNVLAQLEVFKGYNDGSYQPKADITRAEVAAIIYRIATGDVTDSQVSLYSDWNRFKDVSSESWYAGYVNYCANAEYIKGYGDGNFRPQQNVTGYEALAMILRAVGYGKMDEFVGSDWAVNTAARANTLKISRNVTAALLGSPASREVVAELLFRSILVPMVDYTQINGYTDKGITLAYDSFKLEAVEGVVVANEYANLYETEVLANDKTDLEEADGTIRHLDITSALTDVGEARYAYIIDSPRGAQVLALEDTGTNNVFDNTTGEDQDIATAKKFKDVSGIELVEGEGGTEFYVNFGREGYYTCDQRLEFQVFFFNPTAESTFDDKYEDISEYVKKCNADDNKDNDWTTPKYEGTEKVESAYNRVIRAGEQITKEEMEIIRGIFAAADNNITEESRAQDKLTGDVYVGTKSNKDEDNKERDLSNDISFRKFQDEYINSEAWDRNFEESENGEWLKIVDNDNDGKAEYAFLTEYYLDEVVRVSTKNDETKYEYRYLDVDEDTARYLTEDKLELGSIVLYSLIDGQALIEVPQMVTDEINAISFKDVTITTDSGETYGQSGIYNETKMDEVITNMDEDVKYNMYLDKYGFVRAYELADGIKYALVTELYAGTYKNGRYVKNTDLTVELKAGEAASEEFNVLNASKNVFDMREVPYSVTDCDNWSELTDLGKFSVDYKDFDKNAETHILLQPATAHLGLAEDGSDLFNPAITNVAKYVQTDDGVRINTASEFAYTTTGEQIFYADAKRGEKTWKSDWTADWLKDHDDKKASDANTAWDEWVKTAEPVYAVDYVELDATKNISADQWKFDTALEVVNNYTVNAVHDTEFYIVERGDEGRIRYFTDYENLPAISVADDDIRAVYAVAQNTTADSNERDYWVADVIVIEVGSYIGNYDSISMVVRNPRQDSGATKRLDTLNNESSDPELTIIPGEYDWAPERTDNGFYKLYETKMENDELIVDDISAKIKEGEYNKNHIFAGIVERLNEVNSRGGYIVVTTDDDRTEEKVSASVPVYGIDGKTIKKIDLDNEEDRSDVKTGDRVIWVQDNDKHDAFIVDVTSHKYSDIEWATPDWLWDQNTADTDSEWEYIWREQNTKGTSTNVNVTFFGKTAYTEANGVRTIEVNYADAVGKTGLTISGEKEYRLTKGGNTLTAANVKLEGTATTYQLTVTDKDGKLYNYTLVQKAPTTGNAALSAGSPAGFTLAGNTITPTANWTPREIAESAIVSNNGKITWTFITTGGTVITGSGYGANAKFDDENAADAHHSVKDIEAIVTSENGHVEYYRTGTWSKGVKLTLNTTGLSAFDGSDTPGEDTHISATWVSTPANSWPRYTTDVLEGASLKIGKRNVEGGTFTITSADGTVATVAGTKITNGGAGGDEKWVYMTYTVKDGDVIDFVPVGGAALAVGANVNLDAGDNTNPKFLTTPNGEIKWEGITVTAGYTLEVTGSETLNADGWSRKVTYDAATGKYTLVVTVVDGANPYIGLSAKRDASKVAYSAEIIEFSAAGNIKVRVTNTADNTDAVSQVTKIQIQVQDVKGDWTNGYATGALTNTFAAGKADITMTAADASLTGGAGKVIRAIAFVDGNAIEPTDAVTVLN